MHRDLKPSNILVDIDDCMKLADFGISRFLKEDETTIYTNPRGTQGWMPAEVIEAANQRAKNKDVTIRYKKKSDVEVVGMISFFILTKGEHPFGDGLYDQMSNILKGNPVKLQIHKNHEAREFVSWLIGHNINKRPYADQALKHPFMIRVGNSGRPLKPIVLLLDDE